MEDLYTVDVLPFVLLECCSARHTAVELAGYQDTPLSLKETQGIQNRALSTVFSGFNHYVLLPVTLLFIFSN